MATFLGVHNMMQQTALTFITVLIVLGCAEAFRIAKDQNRNRVDAYLVALSVIGMLGTGLFGLLVLETPQAVWEATRNLTGFAASLVLLQLSVWTMLMLLGRSRTRGDDS